MNLSFPARALLLCLLAATGFATAQSCFESSPSIRVGTQPYSIAVADWNDDGVPDLVVANRGSDNLSILLGDGTGDFEVTSTVVTSEEPVVVCAGHFDADGVLDLAVVHSIDNDPGDQLVQILAGTGTGGFQLSQELLAGAAPFDALVEDLNGDGIDDLVVANCASDDLSIYYSDGGGLGAPVLLTNVGNCPRTLASGDFDGDGIIDLALGAGFDVRVYSGTGTGFTISDVILFDNFVTHVNAGDLNGDGNDDVLLDGLGGNQLHLFFGDGTGQFGAQVDTPPIESALFETGIGDFDLDGNVDLLALAGAQFDRVWFLSGDGTGNFTPRSATSVGTGDLAVADLDGDGDLDAATLHQASHDLGVLINDGLGGFDTGDVSFEVTPEATVLTAGDFDGDGQVDVATVGFDVGAIFLATPTGEFVTPGSFPVLNGFAVESADLDGDGNRDLVVLRSLSSSNPPDGLDVFLGDGTGNVIPGFTIDLDLGVTTDLEIVDVDGDGHLDLLAVYDALHVLLGDGTGNFTALAPLPLGPLDRGATCADFNGDGHLDVAVTGSPDVSLYVGDGLGGFSLLTQLPIGENFASLAAGDFDGNGTIDLAVSRTLAGTLQIALGDGQGGFTVSPAQDTGFERLIAATDIDQNGTLDLVTAGIAEIIPYAGDGAGNFNRLPGVHIGESRRSLLLDVDGDDSFDIASLNKVGVPSRVTILRGLACAFRRGDPNADGFFNLGDIVILVNYVFGLMEISCEASADVDDDGDTDFLDPIYALNAQFLGGPPPTAPFGACGEDPTPDGLTCDVFDCP